MNPACCGKGSRFAAIFEVAGFTCTHNFVIQSILPATTAMMGHSARRWRTALFIHHKSILYIDIGVETKDGE